MKAVVLCGKGKVEYRDVPKPELGEEDFLLEVKACGICGSDLHFYYGSMEPVGKTPLVMGHEFVGVVAEKGPKATDRWKIGDRVVSENTGDACGHCSSCSQGNFVACENRETMGVFMDGGFTSYVRIPGKLLSLYPNCLWKIPENISFQEATLMDPAANGYHAVVQQGGLRSGEIAVVFGVGALGLMSIAQAHLAGASKVIAVGMSSDRARREQIALGYGADVFLATDEEKDLVGKIKAIAGEDGVALAVDAAGHPSVTETAIQVVRTEGTIVRIGLNGAPYGNSLNSLSLKNITLTGHMGYNQVSWRNSLALVRSGRLDLKPVITCEMPLADYHKGFEMTRKQEASKVILIP